MTNEEFLKTHPFIDNFDFTHIRFESTCWQQECNNCGEDHDLYDLHWSFAKVNDGGEVEYGMIYRPHIYAESLKELTMKLDVIKSIGMFDNLIVMDSGILFDDEGDELGQIDWNELHYINILEANGYKEIEKQCGCRVGVCECLEYPCELEESPDTEN